eukprot:9484818-Alexandrium_andersonii.AAC.1
MERASCAERLGTIGGRRCHLTGLPMWVRAATGDRHGALASSWTGRLRAASVRAAAPPGRGAGICAGAGAGGGGRR